MHQVGLIYKSYKTTKSHSKYCHSAHTLTRAVLPMQEEFWKPVFGMVVRPSIAFSFTYTDAKWQPLSPVVSVGRARSRTVCGLEDTVTGEWLELEFCSVPKTAALLRSFLGMCDTDFTCACCREISSFRMFKSNLYEMPVSLALSLVPKHQSGIMLIELWIYFHYSLMLLACLCLLIL